MWQGELHSQQFGNTPIGVVKNDDNPRANKGLDCAWKLARPVKIHSNVWRGEASRYKGAPKRDKDFLLAHNRSDKDELQVLLAARASGVPEHSIVRDPWSGSGRGGKFVVERASQGP